MASICSGRVRRSRLPINTATRKQRRSGDKEAVEDAPRRRHPVDLSGDDKTMSTPKWCRSTGREQHAAG